jgi:hypothetical protein
MYGMEFRFLNQSRDMAHISILTTILQHVIGIHIVLGILQPELNITVMVGCLALLQLDITGLTVAIISITMYHRVR